MPELLLHARMLADRVRSAAYERAIASVVRPGDVAIDLGTGTGIHAVLACQAGARMVFAIEESSIIEVARQVAAANGVTDRIEFVQGRSDEIELPCPADVLIADVRGVLPHFGTALSSMIDARERLLHRDGRIVPARDTVFAALAESRSTRLLHEEAWSHPLVDMAPARSMASNTTHKHLFARDELLSAPAVIANVDYGTLATPDLAARAELEATRAGTVHGLALWFDTLLAPGVQLSNAPGEAQTIYGQLFVPFETPVQLSAGDAIVAEISARIHPGASDYLWRWRTSLVRKGETTALFDQSSFFAGPVAGGRRE